MTGLLGRAASFFLSDVNGVVEGDIVLPPLEEAHLVAPMPMANTLRPVPAHVADANSRSAVSKLIRKSVVSNVERSVSPPVRFGSTPSVTGSPLLVPSSQSSAFPATALDEAAPSKNEGEERRLHITRTFPSCTFGRHTSLRGTPYRVRHFAVSRFHFSIVLVPNDCFDALGVSTARDVGACNPEKHNRSSAAKFSTTESATAVTDPSASFSYVLWNWSENPVFINTELVPSLGRSGFVLHHGDIISMLECAFDANAGILTPTCGTSKRLFSADGADAATVTQRGTVYQLLRKKKSVTNDEDDELVFSDDKEYDPYASPLRIGTSIRHPEPIPVFQLRRRERSPSPTVVRPNKASSEPSARAASPRVKPVSRKRKR